MPSTIEVNLGQEFYYSCIFWKFWKTATKCVAIQKNFKSQKSRKKIKSQKMLFSVVKVLFPTKKTATKCVAIQKISKS